MSDGNFEYQPTGLLDDLSKTIRELRDWSAGLPRPAVVLEREHDIRDLMALKAQRDTAVQDAAAITQKLRKQLEAAKRKGAAQAVADGQMQPATWVEINSLEDGIVRAANAEAEKRAEADAIQVRIAAAEADAKTLLLDWELNNESGPGVREEQLVRELLEAIPLASALSIKRYHRARKELGWDAHRYPADFALGPAGALIEEMQRMRWPDWPISLRPSWAPAKGRTPSVREIAEPLLVALYGGGPTKEDADVAAAA